MQTTLDKQASKNRSSGHTEDDMNEEDPTQGIPDWLQPFTENLEDLETHVPAHPLKESSQIRKVMIQKWRHKNGSTVFTLTSLGTEIATCAWEPKLRGFLAEDAMRDLFHEQKSLVTW